MIITGHHDFAVPESADGLSGAPEGLGAARLPEGFYVTGAFNACDR